MQQAAAAAAAAGQDPVAAAKAMADAQQQAALTAQQQQAAAAAVAAGQDPKAAVEAMAAAQRAAAAAAQKQQDDAAEAARAAGQDPAAAAAAVAAAQREAASAAAAEQYAAAAVARQQQQQAAAAAAGASGASPADASARHRTQQEHADGSWRAEQSAPTCGTGEGKQLPDPKMLAKLPPSISQKITSGMANGYDGRLPRSTPKTPPRKKCEHCGALNPTARQFCVGCGTRFNIKQKRDARNREAQQHAAQQQHQHQHQQAAHQQAAQQQAAHQQQAAQQQQQQQQQQVPTSPSYPIPPSIAELDLSEEGGVAEEGIGSGADDMLSAADALAFGSADALAAANAATVLGASGSGEGAHGGSPSASPASHHRRRPAGAVHKTCPACAQQNTLGQLSCVHCGAKFSVSHTALLLAQRHSRDESARAPRFAELESADTTQAETVSANVSSESFKTLPLDAQIQVRQEKAAQRLLAQTLHQQMLQELHKNPALAADPEQQMHFRRLAQQQLLYQMALAAQAADEQQDNGLGLTGGGVDAGRRQRRRKGNGRRAAASRQLAHAWEGAADDYFGHELLWEGGANGSVNSGSVNNASVNNGSVNNGSVNGLDEGAALLSGLGGPAMGGGGSRARARIKGARDGRSTKGASSRRDAKAPPKGAKRIGGGGDPPIGEWREETVGDWGAKKRRRDGREGTRGGEPAKRAGSAHADGKRQRLKGAGAGGRLHGSNAHGGGGARKPGSSGSAPLERAERKRREEEEDEYERQATIGANRMSRRERHLSSQLAAQAELQAVARLPKSSTQRLLKQLADFNPVGKKDSAANLLLPNEHAARERGAAWRLEDVADGREMELRDQEMDLREEVLRDMAAAPLEAAFALDREGLELLGGPLERDESRSSFVSSAPYDDDDDDDDGDDGDDGDDAPMLMDHQLGMGSMGSAIGGFDEDEDEGGGTAEGGGGEVEHGVEPSHWHSRHARPQETLKAGAMRRAVSVNAAEMLSMLPRRTDSVNNASEMLSMLPRRTISIMGAEALTALSPDPPPSDAKAAPDAAAEAAPKAVGALDAPATVSTEAALADSPAAPS